MLFKSIQILSILFKMLGFGDNSGYQESTHTEGSIGGPHPSFPGVPYFLFFSWQLRGSVSPYKATKLYILLVLNFLLRALYFNKNAQFYFIYLKILCFQ